jgi:PAS domain S-box-containing protein
MAAVNLIGSYNYALVALSVLIAIFASYTALDLAGRVTAATGWTRAVWLLGGAGAMGTGIWSMHYIGMLAFILPIPVAYHWPTVLLSLLAAIIASAIALGVASRQKMGRFRALAGSVLMGAGIASMHYIGMAAMRLPALCHFNSFLVVLSVAFAVLISLAALWITFHFRDEKTGIGWDRLVGAVVMGAAIPVMHYTGMAAASFTPSSLSVDLTHAVGISTVGTAGIAAATFIVLGLALMTSWKDRQSAAQTLELQEAKLQRSEAYLAEAQRLTHTGSWAWRVAGQDVLHLSEEMYRIYGFDPGKAPPTFEERLQRTHPEDRAKLQGAIDRAIAEKSDYEVEFRILLPNGTVKYIHSVGHPILNASGDLVEFAGSATDITDRKRAEGLLAGEKRLLEMIARGDSLELVLEAICLFVEDQSRGVLSSILLLDPNGSCLRHGAAPSLPKSYTQAIDGAAIGPRAGSCGTAAYRAEQVVVSDIARDPLWTDYKDLALAHGLRACWSTPIISSEGKVLGTFAMYRREPGSPSPQELDLIEQLTHLAGVALERKRTEETLHQALADLARVNRITTMGELTASLAHEVNQPIAAAVTNANTCLRWLTRDHPDLEEAREAASRIVKDATRAADIISRIRLHFKKGTQERELVDVNEVIQEMILLLHNETTRHNLWVWTELATDLPEVMGDRVQLQQVMMNLIMNGIDAMKELDGARGLGIKSQRAEDGHLLVSVSDTGVGLPSQEANQIFNAFFTTKPDGTGMGLSISRSIVESHGGRLWATANPGRGATFHLTLPTKVEAQE